MKFGQLIEYKIRHIFLENTQKCTQNVVKKLLPDPVVESQNWSYLWVKFYGVSF